MAKRPLLRSRRQKGFKMLENDRARELVKELMEQSDGTRADDYAALLEDLEDRISEKDKLEAQVKKVENANTLLKRENFRLFERVGASGTRVTENDPNTDTDLEKEKQPLDYLKGFIDNNGFFN